MAEAYDVLVAPHCPLGPIALAASLQLDFAVPNFLIQEQSLGIGYGDSSGLLGYLADASPFEVQDGYIHRLTAPGLGITVDEDKVRAAAERGHRWRNPVWRNADGSLASW
jgi:galactonate dehydratase